MKNRLLVLLMFFQTVGVAQTAKRLWTKPVDPGLQWTFVAADGTLVTATTDEAPRDSTVIQFTTLRGIDPTNGNEKWKYTPPVTSLVPGAEAILNSNYIKLNTSKLIIIDPNDGRVVIDPDLFNEVYNFGFLAEPTRLWVEGLFGNTREIGMFDLTSGKRLWSRSDYFQPPQTEGHKKYGIEKTASKVAVKILPPKEDKSTAPGLLCNPIFPDNEHMIFLTGDHANYNDIYKISSIDGDIDWKVAGAFEKIAPMLDVNNHLYRLTLGLNQFFLIRENWVMSYSKENGDAIWKDRLKTKGSVTGVWYPTKDNLLFSLTTDLNLVESTKHFMTVNEASGVEVESHKISLLGSITAEGPGKFYSFSKEDYNLYETDKATSASKILNKQPIDFKSVDVPNQIEARPEGVLLYSDQNVMFINFDGTTRYQNHYDKVSEFETNFFKSIVKDGATFSRGPILLLLTAMGKSHHLELILKETGETLAKVNVASSDLKPVFEIDVDNQRLFYRYQDKLIVFAFGD